MKKREEGKAIRQMTTKHREKDKPETDKEVMGGIDSGRFE